MNFPHCSLAWKHFFRIQNIFFSSVFISLYDFNQSFWLKLINLCTFFRTNPWFNACFKFYMWITCFPLSCKLAASFSISSILFFQAKKGCEIHVIFQDIENQLEKFILMMNFYEIFIPSRCFFNPLKIIYRYLLWYCPSIQVIYVPIRKIRLS